MSIQSTLGRSDESFRRVADQNFDDLRKTPRVYAVSSSYTFLDTDAISTLLVDATAGASVITLPSPTGSRRRRVIKTDSTSNSVTVFGMIDGVSNYTLALQYDFVEVEPTGTAWLITTYGRIGPIRGTTTNNNAAAGFVGEYIESILTSGSAVSLSTGTDATITSISLTAGDWDVSGITSFIVANTTTLGNAGTGIGLTNNTYAGAAYTGQWVSVKPNTTIENSRDLAVTTPVRRISIASTTTVYLIAAAMFAVSTVAAYGAIRARRVR